MPDIITELLDIARTGAILAGADVPKTAKEIVDEWNAQHFPIQRSEIIYNPAEEEMINDMIDEGIL